MKLKRGAAFTACKTILDALKQEAGFLRVSLSEPGRGGDRGAHNEFFRRGKWAGSVSVASRAIDRLKVETEPDHKQVVWEAAAHVDDINNEMELLLEESFESMLRAGREERS